MRDPTRIKKILNRIERIWTYAPDLRLGQLLINAETLVETNGYQVEDNRLLQALDTYIARFNIPELD